MKIRLLIILLLATTITQAQTIKGRLLDLIDNKPLAGATLELRSVKDSTSRYGAVSDSTGRFTFRNLTNDSFLLQVSYIGYENFRQFAVVNDTMPNADLGTLFIPKSTKEIGGVTVTSRTPPAQQKGDTTQYNASQFKVNPDASTEDLIKKMPGITVEKDGSVTAQGETVRKVTIDGRDFFGDDATTALRNLPSEVVDKIQVFDRLSDQAQFTGVDDGNSQRAINIVTKSGIRNGQFGRIYAGIGTDQRYSAGGNVSFFKDNRRVSIVGNFNNINLQNFAAQDLLGVTSSNNRGGGGNFGGGGNRGGGPGGGGGNPRGGGGGGFGSDNFTVGQQSGISKTNAIGINYTDKWGKKADIQGSYFFNNTNNANERILKSQTLFGTRTQFINQNSVSESNNNNHRVNLRLEYRIDSNNSLIISPSLNFQNNNSASSSSSQTLNDADTANTSISDTRNVRDGYNIRNNILYRHSFPKRGRTFSINFNTTFNKNDGESFVNSKYRFFDEFGNVSDSLQDQYTLNPTTGYTLSSNISYTEPIGKVSQLQFNYQPSYSKNKADQQTYTFDAVGGKYSNLDPRLSNKFDNTTTTHNGGATLRIGNTRDNQFSAGLNVQHSKLESERVFPTVTQVNKTFTNLLPNIQFRRKISTRSSINLFYRANTNFPSVTQLQDVVNQSNPLRVSSGNPDLKQSYTHFVSGRYTFTNTQKGQSFFANLFLQAAQDYIANATFSPIADSVIEQGVVLKANTQFIKPVNLDGYRNVRTFFTYGMPVKFIKSNINLSTGFSYSRLPGLANNLSTITNNYIYTAGIVIASNISEFIDFNVSYNANLNNTKSTAQNETSRFLNQIASVQLNLLSKTGWFIQNDVNNQNYSGDGFNENFTLWNAAIGKKFLKNKVGELKLSVFDLLKQNQSITRTVSENYIEDLQTKVLQQYFMLTFTYSLKNFGTAARQNQQQRTNRPGF